MAGLEENDDGSPTVATTETSLSIAADDGGLIRLCSIRVLCECVTVDR
jgi:hypothetical protein